MVGGAGLIHPDHSPDSLPALDTLLRMTGSLSCALERATWFLALTLKDSDISGQLDLAPLEQGLGLGQGVCVPVP